MMVGMTEFRPPPQPHYPQPCAPSPVRDTSVAAVVLTVVVALLLLPIMMLGWLWASAWCGVPRRWWCWWRRLLVRR